MAWSTAVQIDQGERLRGREVWEEVWVTGEESLDVVGICFVVCVLWGRKLEFIRGMLLGETPVQFYGYWGSLMVG